MSMSTTTVERERRVLDRHFRHWRERGLVTEELAETMMAASAELGHAHSHALVRLALAALGGSLLLAGLILVIAENWVALPRGAKLAGWATLQASFLLGVHRLRLRLPDRPYLAQTLEVVAGGWMLGGIALVSQIYQLDSRPPNGIWLWLVLVLPMTFVSRSAGGAAVAWIALIAGLALEVNEPGSWLEAMHAESPWLWLTVPVLATAVISYLPGGRGAVRSLTAAIVFTVGQFFLLVFGAEQYLHQTELGHAWVLVVAGLAAGLFLPSRVWPESWGPQTGRLILLATLLPWLALGSRYDNGSPFDLVAIGLCWVMGFVTAVLVIRAGATGSRSWVNVGFVALLLGVVVRYFDFFGDYLEGGTALALTGLLLLFVLYVLEKARRRTLGREATS